MKHLKTPNLRPSDEDAPAFGRLTKRNQALWQGWSAEFAAVAKGHGTLEARLTRAGVAMGVSYKSARRTWDRCLAEGWRGAIDWRSQQRAEESAVPQRTREFFKSLCENEASSCSLAWMRMVTEYRGGAVPPGYDEYPLATVATGLPAGWSKANFLRHAPTRYELKAVRIGRAAAADLRPLVLTTRVGLRVGQVYMFDDMWHNLKCAWVGVAREGIRPQEMCCLDVASACKVMYGMRPRVRGDDGKHKQLTERDMRFLVVAVLYLVGYRPDGTFLVVEHGTAAIREEGPYRRFGLMLTDLTGGAVKIVRGGIQDAPAVMGGWPGPKRGNPRLKAALESAHRMFQSGMGLLPGQTGSNNRIDKPERLAGTDAYTEGLLREVAKLPAARLAEMVEKLRFGYVHWHDYAGIVSDVYRWINDRTLHNLEGWEQCGYTAQEYRLDTASPLWLPCARIQALPAPQQDAVLAVIRQPGHMQIRKLSPAEVSAAGRRELVRLQPEHIPTLLGPDLAVAKTLDQHHCFVLRGHEYGLTDAVRYPAARVRNSLGQDVVLDPRKTYQVFPNPFDMDHLVVCDEGLRYIGVCHRQAAASRADLDAIHRAIGQAAHQELALNAPIRARHHAEAEERAQMVAHNREVLANAGAIDVGEEKNEAAAADEENVEAGLSLLESAMQ